MLDIEKRHLAGSAALRALKGKAINPEWLG